MGRSLSPILRQELENLEKDAHSRKSAMKALKSYVKELDSKAIPLFLAQVSDTKDAGCSSGEFTISLYEVLARVHGPKIVPQIHNIMTTIIKTLTASAGSFALHQACSKVVPAIARYGIDPTTPEDKKRYIIRSLCDPLSDSLLGTQESLSSGSALCLKALVDSDNWRFASSEMVNEVCQRVAGALERPSQTNSHIGLAMSLAKHNSLIVEAYARLLVQSGLRILNVGFAEGNSQKRLSAIQMVNFLMKCLDPKSIFSELESIMEEMERCQSDQMAFVRGAAFETLQTARRIAAEEGSKLEREAGSITGSNYCKSENGRRRNLQGAGNTSPLTASPESQTVDSFAGYDSFIESPISTSELSPKISNDQRSVNRKLWRRYDNGGVEVSLKDGFYSEGNHGCATENSDHEGFSDNRNYANGFAGFLQESPPDGAPRSTAPSPQSSRPQINVDNVKIFTTPRKLICSLQDPQWGMSDLSVKQTARLRSPFSNKLELSPTSKYDQNGILHDIKHEVKRDENLNASGKQCEQFHSSSESVSSTENTPTDAGLQMLRNVTSGTESEAQCIILQKNHQKSASSVVYCIFLVLFAVSVCLLWFDDHDGGCILVPT